MQQVRPGRHGGAYRGAQVIPDYQCQARAATGRQGVQRTGGTCAAVLAGEGHGGAGTGYEYAAGTRGEAQTESPIGRLVIGLLELGSIDVAHEDSTDDLTG
ncbi:hypothetical protein D3C80_1837500 [compost metagenome]